MVGAFGGSRTHKHRLIRSVLIESCRLINPATTHGSLTASSPDELQTHEQDPANQFALAEATNSVPRGALGSQAKHLTDPWLPG